MASYRGDRKQVQDKQFESHMTGVEERKFLLAHENNGTLQRLSIESGNQNANAPLRVQGIALSASSTQHMWQLLSRNRTAVLPRHAWGRRIMGWRRCAPCFKFFSFEIVN